MLKAGFTTAQVAEVLIIWIMQAFFFFFFFVIVLLGERKWASSR